MVSPQSQCERTVDAGENGRGRETDYMSVSVCLRNPENSECGKCQIEDFFFTEREIKQVPLWYGRTSLARARGDTRILPCVLLRLYSGAHHRTKLSSVAEDGRPRRARTIQVLKTFLDVRHSPTERSNLRAVFRT